MISNQYDINTGTLACIYNFNKFPQNITNLFSQVIQYDIQNQKGS